MTIFISFFNLEELSSIFFSLNFYSIQSNIRKETNSQSEFPVLRYMKKNNFNPEAIIFNE